MSCSGTSTGSVDSIQGSLVPATTLLDSVSARCDRIGSLVIKQFVVGFNDGGVDLDPLFADEPEFQWYSDDQRIVLFGIRPWNPLYEPSVRSTLIAYLSEARRTRGPMTINSLAFTGFRELDQATGYAMSLEWGGTRLGKASVHCRLGQISVWSLGSPNP